MDTLSKWLEARNLENLTTTLKEAEIDLDILHELTDEDLREIGLSLGARKRLRSAIDGAALKTPSANQNSKKATSGAAERRQLTTMFVDLVGSTALSAQLDPEDMREVITRYQNTVAGVVTRYSGHVAKYMGDGILCYFGWPSAHEDDARRSARSGLEIVETVNGTLPPTVRHLRFGSALPPV